MRVFDIDTLNVSITVLQHKQPEVRLHAAEELAGAKGFEAEVIPALIAVVKKERAWYAQREMIGALGKLAPLAKDALPRIKVLKKKYRAEAEKAIKAIKGSEGRAWIREVPVFGKPLTVPQHFALMIQLVIVPLQRISVAGYVIQSTIRWIARSRSLIPRRPTAQKPADSFCWFRTHRLWDTPLSFS
jgi:hypothetical protein